MTAHCALLPTKISTQNLIVHFSLGISAMICQGRNNAGKIKGIGFRATFLLGNVFLCDDFPSLIIGQITDVIMAKLANVGAVGMKNEGVRVSHRSVSRLRVVPTISPALTSDVETVCAKLGNNGIHSAHLGALDDLQGGVGPLVGKKVTDPL